MSYREYMPGWCKNPACQKDLGLVAQGGGRDRKYCDDRCKTQAYRLRKQAEAHLAQARQIKAELIDGYELDEETLKLVARLGEFGPGAIKEGCFIALRIVSSFRARAAARGIYL